MNMLQFDHALKIMFKKVLEFINLIDVSDLPKCLRQV